MFIIIHDQFSIFTNDKCRICGRRIFIWGFLQWQLLFNISRLNHLLSQYFPGYSVTPSGSVLGLAYGFVGGFVAGWGFAFLRNATVFFYMAFVRRRAEWQLLQKFADYL